MSKPQIFCYTYAGGNASFFEAIEKDRVPVCSGAEGRKALELVLGLYASAAEGRPVRFPLERGSTMDFTGRFDA